MEDIQASTSEDKQSSDDKIYIFKEPLLLETNTHMALAKHKSCFPRLGKRQKSGQLDEDDMGGMVIKRRREEGDDNYVYDGALSYMY